MTHEKIKKLEDELEVINNSLQGRKSIEAAKLLTELQTTNSKEILFNAMRELYKFSKKTLKLLDSVSSGAPVPGPTSDDIKSMIKQELTDTLPGLLQEALNNHSSMEKSPNKADDLAVKPSELVHTMEVNIPEVEDDSQPGAWRTALRGPCRSLPVNRAVYDPVKRVAKLHFETKDSMDKAQDACKNSNLTATTNSAERKKILPKLTILNLDPHIDSASVLKEELLDKNSFLRELNEADKSLRIVFVDKKTKPADRYAVIEVSLKIREAIRRNGDKLCIDLERYHVTDRYYVIQCYHCQEYGHMADSEYCKRKGGPATCFYCAGEHTSKECSERKAKKTDKIKCSNCAKSKNRDEKRLCGSHKAGDYACPCYIREKAHLMTRTVGCSVQTKNSYLQKAREIQRRKFGKAY
jgi:hypothetical protein